MSVSRDIPVTKLEIEAESLHLVAASDTSHTYIPPEPSDAVKALPFKMLRKATVHVPALLPLDETSRDASKNSGADFSSQALSVHPAEFARIIGNSVSDFYSKASLTYAVVLEHSKAGIYPYDRYLTLGSNSMAVVNTPQFQDTQECVVWCTNLYLALNRHPRVLAAVEAAIYKYGMGSGTSAVSGGFSALHKKLEFRLASFLGKEDAILFATGFTANLGVISSIATPRDIVFFDKECHSSIIDGIRLSGASFRSFRNNDHLHLESLLSKLEDGKYENVFVLTESVFGMTGELAPINEYCKLKKKYKFYLFVDEAHSFGFYGKNGRGVCDYLNCAQDVDFIMATLSKATGSVGGFVACKKVFTAYLRISSNAYLFQATIPPTDIAAVLESLNIIESEPALIEKLWDNTALLRTGFIELGFDVGNGSSPVIPIYIKQDNILADMCKFLYERGIYTNWIAYPAVKKGHGRLRFIASAGHTEIQILRTLEVLKEAADYYGIT
jgi:glycine C-acetyltransferase